MISLRLDRRPILIGAALLSLGVLERSMSMARAGDVSVSSSSSSSATATAKSSSIGSTTGGCVSHATAEATTTVNGLTRTVRHEDSDQGKDCNAHSEAKASIETDSEERSPTE